MCSGSTLMGQKHPACGTPGYRVGTRSFSSSTQQPAPVLIEELRAVGLLADALRVKHKGPGLYSRPSSMAFTIEVSGCM